MGDERRGADGVIFDSNNLKYNSNTLANLKNLSNEMSRITSDLSNTISKLGLLILSKIKSLLISCKLISKAPLGLLKLNL